MYSEKHYLGGNLQVIIQKDYEKVTCLLLLDYLESTI